MNVTVPCAKDSGTSQEGSGFDLEAGTCSVTKECAVAFDAASGRPIKCHEQDDTDIASKSLSLIIKYWLW